MIIKPRLILVTHTYDLGWYIKLCNRDVNENIFKCCKVVKPQKFYINESLTPLRNTILYVMRQAENKQPSEINSCNSSDGGVVAWLHAASASARTKYQKSNYQHEEGIGSFSAARTQHESNVLHWHMACFLKFIMQYTNHASLSSM